MIKLDHSRASSTEIFGNIIEDKINSIEGIVQETSSACILVCDDNHFLIEWIAYHYFAVDLRYLIVTRDPRCRTSPDHILDRWRDKLTIEYWNDSRFLEIDGDKTVLETHRARQSQFYIECLRTLKRKNQSWVLLTDTDEFVTINPKKSFGTNLFSKSEEKNKSLLFPKMERLPSISEPGSVMTFLKNVIVPDKNIGLKGPCLPIYRKQFSARESSKEEVEQGLSDSLLGKASFDYMAFLTLRWRKWGAVPEGVFKTMLGKECFTRRHIIPGKVVIDLSRIREQDLYHTVSDRKNKIPGKVAIDLSRIREQDLYYTGIRGNPHRPVESICPDGTQYIEAKKAGLIIHHYLGTEEQYNYRSTDSRGEGYRMAHYRQIHSKLGFLENDHLKPWLEGFVWLVGENEASRLLRDVGELEPTIDDSGQELNLTLPLIDSELGGKTYKVGDLVQGKYKGEWYWAQVTDVIAGMYPGKVVIDLSRIREQDLYHTDIKGDPHRPVESVCPQGIQSTKEKAAGLILHHYLGSPEQYFYRSTDSRGEGYRMAHYRQIHNKLGSTEDDHLKPWLMGFVRLVGEDEASRLLKDVGELEATIDDSGQELNWNLTLMVSELGGKTYKVGDLVQGKYDGEWYWAQVTDVIAGMYYNLVLIDEWEDCLEIIGVESNKIRLRGYTDDDLTQKKIKKRIKKLNIKNKKS
eukprot:CAMPEP_0194298508 /NCGR_PEP_ID=MMETSP0169-20130528/60200_1 /TAXON_ID=218684 /ORGANISM="Corethron pennatum, Strain L29A3" /LENGTH=690 /DNA_ID=CAMNT_0039048503 /DNA_START=1307 /DNA_END=3380 /DNA_ORIENTATION=+